jgi:hypothetical protein
MRITACPVKHTAATEMRRSPRDTLRRSRPLIMGVAAHSLPSPTTKRLAHADAPPPGRCTSPEVNAPAPGHGAAAS